MKSSKFIPFLVLLIVGGFMAVDMFTTYTITDQMLDFAVIILTPMGVGGIAKHAVDIYKSTKKQTAS